MSTLHAIDCLLRALEAATKGSQQQIASIVTTIIYMRDTGRRYLIDLERGERVCEAVGILAEIHNAWNTHCILKSHGFQLLPQRTTLKTMDFYQNTDGMIQSEYYKQIESVVQKLTGAQLVKAFEHQIQCSTDSIPRLSTEHIGSAAHGAHCDFTAFRRQKHSNRRYHPFQRMRSQNTKMATLW